MFVSMVYQALVASCSATPASSMISTKGCELPSMIGTSGPLISMRQLSTPIPTRPANMCSTVLTCQVDTLKLEAETWVGRLQGHIHFDPGVQARAGNTCNRG